MKNKVLYPLYFAFAVLLGLALGVFLDYEVKPPGVGLGPKEQKLREVINYIDYQYVDDVNTDSLLDETITGILEKLDPHSSYIPQSEVASNQEAIEGEFDGIGIEFKIVRDSLTVVHVIPGGPSEKAGIEQGQRILAADSVELHGSTISNRKVIETLKGRAGSEVNLTVWERGKSARSIEVERGPVNLKSVPSAFMMDTATGYLKLRSFSANSSREVKQALENLKEQGARKVIFDLRDNPGGLLSAARDVASEFLEEDKLIVITKDRGGRENQIRAEGGGAFTEGELIVLINNGSASASEIVAGALQDQKRATIVGQRSFGKGLVQEEMNLRDGSKLRLTTQRFYTPDGRSIQKPYNSYGDEFSRYHSFNKLKESQDSALADTSAPRQGGIIPNVKVDGYTQHSIYVARRIMGLEFDQKAFTYVDQHRDKLDKMGPERFVSDFEVGEELLQNFMGDTYQSKKWEQKIEQQQLLRNKIKALIGYNAYGSEVYQKVVSRYDPYILKSKALMESS